MGAVLDFLFPGRAYKRMMAELADRVSAPLLHTPGTRGLEAVLSNFNLNVEPTSSSDLDATEGYDPFVGTPEPFEEAIARMRVFIENNNCLFRQVDRFKLDQSLTVVDGYLAIVEAHLALPWKSYKERAPRRFACNAEDVLEARADARVALFNLQSAIDRLIEPIAQADESPVPQEWCDFNSDIDVLVDKLQPLDDEFVGRHTATTNEQFPGLTEPDPKLRDLFDRWMKGAS